jgi:hypothetical protein
MNILFIVDFNHNILLSDIAFSALVQVQSNALHCSVPIIGLDIYIIFLVASVLPTITVNQANDVPIIGLISGQLFNNALSVTVPLPVSISKNAVAQAPLISVPLPVALVTVIALVVV